MLKDHELVAARHMSTDDLVEALCYALELRDAAEKERASLRAKYLEQGDMLDEAQASCQALLAKADEAAAAHQEVDRLSQVAAQCGKELERLKTVVRGMEIALRHNGLEAAIAAIRDSAMGVGPDQEHISDPLKFLYRMASRATHPDLGGDPELFIRVQAAHQQLAEVV